MNGGRILGIGSLLAFIAAVFAVLGGMCEYFGLFCPASKSSLERPGAAAPPPARQPIRQGRSSGIDVRSEDAYESGAARGGPVFEEFIDGQPPSDSPVEVAPLGDPLGLPKVDGGNCVAVSADGRCLSAQPAAH